MKTNAIKDLLISHASGRKFIIASAAAMDEIYEEARSLLISRIVQHSQSYSSPYTGKYLVKLLNDLKEKFAGLEEALMDRLKEDIPFISQSYYYQALLDLDKASPAALGQLDEARINYFIDDTYNHVAGATTKLEATEIARLRKITAKVERVSSLTGDSRAVVSRKLLAEATSIEGFRFIDNGGARWNPKSYFNMLGRTTLMNAGRSTYLDACAKNKHDVVRVTISGNPCPLCQPWENRLLSISGKTAGLPTVDYAIGKGLTHPNCTHSFVAEAVTKQEQFKKNGYPKNGYKPPPLSISTNKEAWKKYRAANK